MSLILLIAGRELRSFLLAPLGYLIMASVLCLHGLLFNVTLLQAELSSYEVVQGFFYQSCGFVSSVGVLLSMRLFSEERQTGTLALLLTSPAREWQLVLGKFLGALGFLCLYLALTVYMPVLISIHGEVSGGHLVAGYSGLLLLAAITVAIGTFASTLVDSSLLAGVLAGVLMTLLCLCWVVAGAIDGPLGAAVAYLDLMSSHLLSFTRGIIKLSSLIYALSLIYLALLGSAIVLWLRRWNA